MAQQHKSLQTKEKILESAIKLFAKHGFEATTTRMIAHDADVSLSGIAFHFVTKENLYKEALRHVANEISKYYEDIYQKIGKSHKNHAIEPDVAWAYICQMVDLQIEISIERENAHYIDLLHWEQAYSLDDYTPITNTIINKSENTLAQLILVYTKSTDTKWAATISRLVIGGIMSFTEHVLYTYKIIGKESKESDRTWLKKAIREYTLNSIKNIKRQ